MEPDHPIVNHIRCPLHKQDLIRKVGITNKTELSLHCIDCKEGIPNQERITLENFLEKIVHSYIQIPKLAQLPDSTNKILNAESEISTNFYDHIEKQKEQVNIMIDALTQSVTEKLEKKKQQLLANLETQLEAFEDVLTFYKQKVFSYKEGQPTDYLKGHETTATFESLFKEVSRLTNAADLKKFLEMHFEIMKNTAIFTHVKGAEAEKILVDAIEEMDKELLKDQTRKPTVSFGVNNESFEEVFNRWSEQIDAVLAGLKLEVKNPVKPIEFRLPLPTTVVGFDSGILNNYLPDKCSIANWVCESLKTNQISFKLLYRGSRDGFGAKNFHQKCDNQGPTLVVIKSNHGKVFGGFTDVDWDSSNTWKTTNNAFLFSMDRKAKYHVKSPKDAILCYLDRGPTFGNGHDIYICDNCNTVGNSYSNFPHTYICDEYVNPGNKGSNYLAGAYNFTVTEIEVYSI